MTIDYEKPEVRKFVLWHWLAGAVILVVLSLYPAYRVVIHPEHDFREALDFGVAQLWVTSGLVVGLIAAAMKLWRMWR